MTEHTEVAIYRARVLSTQLYGSESWTLYSIQKRKLNAFHMRGLGRILGISWSDKVTNKEVLTRAQIPSLFTQLKQRLFGWLGHKHHMPDKRIPKSCYMGSWQRAQESMDVPTVSDRDRSS